MVSSQMPLAIIPVTIMVRIPVFRSVCITGAVCGFSRFRMTSSPRRLSSCSTVSLESWHLRVRGQAGINAPLPVSGRAGAWAQYLPPNTLGPGSPCQLLSGLQAGCNGQWLASQGYNSVASSCVALQHLRKVTGYCGERELSGLVGRVCVSQTGTHPTSTLTHTSRFWACLVHLSQGCRGWPPALGSL